jgi:hypothetical protein
VNTFWPSLGPVVIRYVIECPEQAVDRRLLARIERQIRVLDGARDEARTLE